VFNFEGFLLIQLILLYIIVCVRILYVLLSCV